MSFSTLPEAISVQRTGDRVTPVIKTVDTCPPHSIGRLHTVNKPQAQSDKATPVQHNLPALEDSAE